MSTRSPDSRVEGIATPGSTTILQSHAERRRWRESYYGRAWHRLRRSWGAMASLVILLGLVSVALLAPEIAPYDPASMSTGERFQPPTGVHLFGTDNFGRDVFSRVVVGARVTLPLGLISVGIAAVLGSLFGLVSGYYGGVVDVIVMRLMDVLLSFPGILLALAIVAILGPGLTNLMVAIGISSIPQYTRLVRGCALCAKEQVYVDAARATGCRDVSIMTRHILPNIVAATIVVSTLGVSNSILIATGMSFLGLGPQPPTAEWGIMLSDARSYMQRAWWLITFPGLAIVITVLAVNMLGDGLRDALDPNLQC